MEWNVMYVWMYGDIYTHRHLFQALQAWAQEVHLAPCAAAEDFQHRPGEGAEKRGGDLQMDGLFHWKSHWKMAHWDIDVLKTRVHNGL